ncbi:hypothetical protein ZEAMMB73_Zm00001d036404 [Zea mays]|uniref:Uncharacterized protein n=1 Tax=Zea mays TaxID=4577 RepID=A0A1D6LMY4_MAIZE|nr:hypothetical protein ZEAMMB73_Zm00001d036404 [Zea mays]
MSTVSSLRSSPRIYKTSIPLFPSKSDTCRPTPIADRHGGRRRKPRTITAVVGGSRCLNGLGLEITSRDDLQTPWMLYARLIRTKVGRDPGNWSPEIVFHRGATRCSERVSVHDESRTRGRIRSRGGSCLSDRESSGGEQFLLRHLRCGNRISYNTSYLLAHRALLGVHRRLPVDPSPA